MNEVTGGLLKSKMARRSMLAAMLPMAGASVALANGNSETSNKVGAGLQLGGAFVGRDPAGDLLTMLQIPLDPAGKTAALQVTLPEYAVPMASLGGDSLSDYVGQAEMVAPNKIKAIGLGYVVASGDPPTVKAIHVLTIDARFTDPDTLEWTGVGNIYAPSADGFPHADLLLVGPFPPVLYLFKRVKP